MNKTTKLVLGVFALLIVGGMVVSSLAPPMPVKNMPPAVQRVTSPMPQETPSLAGHDPSKTVHMSSLPILADRMPAFEGITRWWNTPNDAPLTPASLKGKVVIIDFWTYSCINCIRTYPFIRAMHEKYADKGLVIVGVHTPEFAFEAEPNNVSRELVKNDLRFPIALDPDFKTWNNYDNQYWPAKYFFDRQGRLRFTHFGEGAYDESEEVIRDLLAEGDGAVLGPMADIQAHDFSKIRTHETYFGLSRGAEFMGSTGRSGQEVDLKAAATVSPNMWTAEGKWVFTPEYIENRSAGALFRFNVQAATLHLVMESEDGTDNAVEVYVDGVKVKDITVNASTLYDVASFPDAGRHTVELRFTSPGVRLFAATFS